MIVYYTVFAITKINIIMNAVPFIGREIELNQLRALSDKKSASLVSDIIKNYKDLEKFHLEY